MKQFGQELRILDQLGQLDQRGRPVQRVELDPLGFLVQQQIQGQLVQLVKRVLVVQVQRVELDQLVDQV